MSIFAAEYTYLAEKSHAREANKPAHRAWLKDQVELGTVLSVGPFADSSGALIVMRADSAESAHQTLAEDPHQQRGLVARVTFREWTPVFGAFA